MYDDKEEDDVNEDDDILENLRLDFPILIFILIFPFPFSLENLCLYFPILSDHPVCWGKDWMEWEEDQQKGAHSKNIIIITMIECLLFDIANMQKDKKLPIFYLNK